MAEIGELIETTNDSGSCYRWVPSREEYKAVATRNMDGDLFLQVKIGRGKVVWVELSRDEMLAIGVACIQAANDRGSDDEF